jgi:hypothetical protein
MKLWLQILELNEPEDLKHRGRIRANRGMNAPATSDLSPGRRLDDLSLRLNLIKLLWNEKENIFHDKLRTPKATSLPASPRRCRFEEEYSTGRGESPETQAHFLVH